MINQRVVNVCRTCLGVPFCCKSLTCLICRQILSNLMQVEQNDPYTIWAHMRNKTLRCMQSFHLNFKRSYFLPFDSTFQFLFSDRGTINFSHLKDRNVGRRVAVICTIFVLSCVASYIELTDMRYIAAS